MDSTDYSAVPNNQPPRGNLGVDHYPGRNNRGGEYLLYDPYILFLVDAESTRLGSSVGFPHKSGYSDGFTFVESDYDTKTITEVKISSDPVVAGSVSVVVYSPFKFAFI